MMTLIGFWSGFIAVVGVFFAIGLVIGTLTRSFIQPSRTSLAFYLFVSLVPWFMHHKALLNAAQYPLSENGVAISLPIIIVYAGPSIVVALTIFAVLASDKFRWPVIVVPVLAFSITYLLTRHLIFEMVGYIAFDNIPTIWLFMVSTTTTAFLFGTTRPNPHPQIDPNTF